MRITVNGPIFEGYQFSWFSWRAQNTNSTTHEIAIFRIYIIKSNDYFASNLEHFIEGLYIRSVDINLFQPLSPFHLQKVRCINISPTASFYVSLVHVIGTTLLFQCYRRGFSTINVPS